MDREVKKQRGMSPASAISRSSHEPNQETGNSELVSHALRIEASSHMMGEPQESGASLLGVHIGSDDDGGSSTQSAASGAHAGPRDGARRGFGRGAGRGLSGFQPSGADVRARRVGGGKEGESDEETAGLRDWHGMRRVRGFSKYSSSARRSWWDAIKERWREVAMWVVLVVLAFLWTFKAHSEHKHVPIKHIRLGHRIRINAVVPQAARVLDP
ncbi:hypothetical protein T484DRAFT_3389624 [Baffinella frigidus]|nr:hypothetical protein T484DRAFT_3389624 [Cryptophyta sp. CCMP2293]